MSPTSLVSPRLLLSSAATVVVIVALGVLALGLMSGLQQKVERIATENLAESANVTAARADLYTYRELQFRIAAPAGAATRARAERRLPGVERSLSDLLERQQAIVPPDEAEELELVATITADWERYLDESGPALAAGRRGESARATALLLGAPSETFASVSEGLAELEREEIEQALGTSSAGRRSFALARTVFLVALVAGAALVAGIGLWVFLVAPLRRSGAVESFRRRLHKALEMADSEDEALDVTGRALAKACLDVPVEFLIADSSDAHLSRALVANLDEDAPGCPVDAPMACAAVRRGQPTVFTSSEEIDACPKLRGRPGGPCSAVCTPVSILGRTIGVLHATGPEGRPPGERDRDVLEAAGGQIGSRLGVIRALGQSELQASTDPLTGLLNRRSLEDRVFGLRRARVPYTVAMLDIDHFKRLNDTHGHETGDRALRVFTRVLEEQARSQDIVARWGGEEFVVVLPRCTTHDAAEAMERTREALHEATGESDVPGFTFSVGIAEAAPDESFKGVLTAADEALMAAKRSGRDRVLIASSVRSAPPPAR